MYFPETRWDISQGFGGSKGCHWWTVLYYLQSNDLVGWEKFPMTGKKANTKFIFRKSKLGHLRNYMLVSCKSQSILEQIILKIIYQHMKDTKNIRNIMHGFSIMFFNTKIHYLMKEEYMILWRTICYVLFLFHQQDIAIIKLLINYSSISCYGMDLSNAAFRQ